MPSATAASSTGDGGAGAAGAARLDTPPLREEDREDGGTMISYRGFTKRFGAQRAVESLRPRTRSRLRLAAKAVAGLAVLLGGLALPFLGMVLADEPAPFCCRGRCCCTGETTDARGRPALPARALPLRPARRGRDRRSAAARSRAARRRRPAACRGAPARPSCPAREPRSTGPTRRPSPRRNASSPPDIPKPRERRIPARGGPGSAAAARGRGVMRAMVFVLACGLAVADARGTTGAAASRER